MKIHLHLIQFGLDVWRVVREAAGEGVKGHGSEQICTCRTDRKYSVHFDVCVNRNPAASIRISAPWLRFAYCNAVGPFF